MKQKILLSMMLLTSTTLMAVPHYTIEPLGTLGGEESYANDINDHGQIVGWSKDQEQNKKAIISTVVNGSRVITSLGTLSNGTQSEAKAVRQVKLVISDKVKVLVWEI